MKVEFLKRFNFIVFVIFTFLLISVGCSVKQEEKPTISKSPDSEYEHTFKELNLGILFNFDFYLPHADERWVSLWVERYRNGEKDDKPVRQLIYGLSPDEVEEGPMGFGMINYNTESPLLFLYAPGIRTQPKLLAKQSEKETKVWDYVIGDEKLELELGEEVLLAAYREKEGTSYRTGDLQDEESINRLIEEGDTLYLLKLMVEEDSVSNK